MRFRLGQNWPRVKGVPQDLHGFDLFSSIFFDWVLHELFIRCKQPSQIYQPVCQQHWYLKNHWHLPTIRGYCRFNQLTELKWRKHLGKPGFRMKMTEAHHPQRRHKIWIRNTQHPGIKLKMWNGDKHCTSRGSEDTTPSCTAANLSTQFCFQAAVVRRETKADGSEWKKHAHFSN